MLNKATASYAVHTLQGGTWVSARLNPRDIRLTNGIDAVYFWPFMFWFTERSPRFQSWSLNFF
jgi:hypothetical protein